MLTLILPYLFAVGLLAARHELPRRDRVVMGLLAGLGFSMKPFYGPVWVALVLWLVWKRGRHALQRAEVIAPAAVMSAYIALTAVFARGYFDVAGWAADVYFDYFPTPLRFVVFSLGMAAALGALLIDRAMRTRGPFDSLRRVLLIVLFGSVAVVLVQQKGWSYHWYPVYASAILLADFSILDAVLEQNARLVRVLRPAVAGVSAALLLLVLGSWRLGWSKTFWGDLAGSPYHLPQMRNVVNRFAEGGPIVALSTGMPVGFPLVNYAGVAWASRFSCLWMLPGIYADVTSSGAPFPYHDAASASEIERYLIDAVTEDLRRGDPSLIIVDQAPPSPRMPGFGYIEYFSRDERFREIFERYALIGTVGRYQIFKRVARST
jgi:hypothetical protein